jgi:hypothetical protein
MSHDPHTDGPFDPDDPLSMMGIAIVGMTLQEMAEQEERGYPRRSSSETQYPAWLVGVVIALGILLFLCLVISSG